MYFFAFSISRRFAKYEPQPCPAPAPAPQPGPPPQPQPQQFLRAGLRAGLRVGLRRAGLWAGVGLRTASTRRLPTRGELSVGNVPGLRQTGSRQRTTWARRGDSQRLNVAWVADCFGGPKFT